MISWYDNFGVHTNTQLISCSSACDVSLDCLWAGWRLEGVCCIPSPTRAIPLEPVAHYTRLNNYFNKQQSSSWTWFGARLWTVPQRRTHNTIFQISIKPKCWERAAQSSPLAPHFQLPMATTPAPTQFQSLIIHIWLLTFRNRGIKRNSSAEPWSLGAIRAASLLAQVWKATQCWPGKF